MKVYFAEHLGHLSGVWSNSMGIYGGGEVELCKLTTKRYPQ